MEKQAYITYGTKQNGRIYSEYQKEINELRTRIIKAIYFIRDKGQYDEENNMYKNNVSFWELKELLDILKGSDIKNGI